MPCTHWRRRRRIQTVRRKSNAVNLAKVRSEEGLFVDPRDEGLVCRVTSTYEHPFIYMTLILEKIEKSRKGAAGSIPPQLFQCLFWTDSC
jgi:hypothetical protein